MTGESDVRDAVEDLLKEAVARGRDFLGSFTLKFEVANLSVTEVRKSSEERRRPRKVSEKA